MLIEFGSRRKDLGDKASEKLTPDSQKSTLDQAKESVTDAGAFALLTYQLHF